MEFLIISYLKLNIKLWKKKILKIALLINPENKHKMLSCNYNDKTSINEFHACLKT